MFSKSKKSGKDHLNDHARTSELLADSNAHVANHTSCKILKKSRPKASTHSVFSSLKILIPFPFARYYLLPFILPQHCSRQSVCHKKVDELKAYTKHSNGVCKAQIKLTESPQVHFNFIQLNRQKVIIASEKEENPTSP